MGRGLSAPIRACLMIGSLCALAAWGNRVARAQKAPTSVVLQAPPSVQTSASAARSLTLSVPPNLHVGTFDLVNNKILVRVTLNDDLETRMVIDCGATYSVLSSQAAAALKIPLRSARFMGRPTRTGEISALKIGSATLETVRFILDDSDFIFKFNHDSPGTPISGIIGLDTMEKSAFGFDFVTQTYALWVGGKIKPEDATAFNCMVCTPDFDTLHLLWPGSSQEIGQVTVINPAMKDLRAQALPLDRAKNELAYHTVVTIDDVSLKLYVDTGAAAILVTESQAKMLHPLMTASMRVGFPLEQQRIGTTVMFVHRFQMGSLQRTCPIVCVVHRATENPTDALLAINDTLFADCRVILDFPGHTFYLSPYDARNDGILSGLAQHGLFCRMLQFENTTLFIGKGSPAERAGLKDEDALVGWAGKTVAELANLPDQGASLLNTVPLTVTVRRKGHIEPLTVTLSSDRWAP